MARFHNPTAEQIKLWGQWLAARPDCVRVFAQRFDPWTLYRLKTTGQRVTVASFHEDGTLSVNVTGEFNRVMFDRNVFGINPDDLTECDLPTPSEVTGALLTEEQVEDNIDELRVLVRPDLWFMGDDGIARRKE